MYANTVYQWANGYYNCALWFIQPFIFLRVNYCLFPPLLLVFCIIYRWQPPRLKVLLRLCPKVWQYFLYTQMHKFCFFSRIFIPESPSSCFNQNWLLSRLAVQLSFWDFPGPFHGSHAGFFLSLLPCFAEAPPLVTSKGKGIGGYIGIFAYFKIYFNTWFVVEFIVGLVIEFKFWK